MRRTAVLALLLVAASCSRQQPGDGSASAVQSVLNAPGNLLVGTPDHAKAAEARANRLQIEINDLADLYAAQVSEGCERGIRAVPTTEARMALHRWRMDNASNAWNAASTCETPQRGLMDLMTLTAFARAVMETASQRFKDLPEAGQLYQIHIASEERMWRHAENYFSAAHRQELRQAIDKTIASNPRDRALLSLRLNDLFPELGASGEGKRSGGLLGMLTLDPFSGLDPTTRAINETRRSAERMLYRVERMQTTMRWQVEHLADKLATSPEGAQLLADLRRLGEVGERVAGTAEKVAEIAAALPDRISAERAAVVHAIEANQGKLTGLAVEVRAALDAGRGMSEAVDRALGTFTALVARFQRPSSAAATRPPAPAAAASAAPSRPFDINDYRLTAVEIGRTVDGLDRLVRSASQAADSPAVERHLERIDAAVTRLERAGDALVLKAAAALAGLVMLAGAVALAVRRLGR
jgi:hypothetical protein